MTNNPFLHYKPNLFMSAELTIRLQAADLMLFASWLANLDHADVHGVSHIVQQICTQTADQLFTPDSMKAADAEWHRIREENANSDPIRQFFRMATGQESSGFPTPDDFGPRPRYEGEETWVIRCALCGSLDEYPPYHAGELTCEHNGMREVVEIKQRPKED